jgi:hypothetical protein
MAARRLPEWLLSADTDPDVYVTIETVLSDSQKKKATDIDIMLMTRWMSEVFPGTTEARHMRDGRLLL